MQTKYLFQLLSPFFSNFVRFILSNSFMVSFHTLCLKCYILFAFKKLSNKITFFIASNLPLFSLSPFLKLEKEFIFIFSTFQGTIANISY